MSYTERTAWFGPDAEGLRAIHDQRLPEGSAYELRRDGVPVLSSKNLYAIISGPPEMHDDALATRYVVYLDGAPYYAHHLPILCHDGYVAMGADGSYLGGEEPAWTPDGFARRASTLAARTP